MTGNQLITIEQNAPNTTLPDDAGIVQYLVTLVEELAYNISLDCLFNVSAATPVRILVCRFLSLSTAGQHSSKGFLNLFGNFIVGV